MILHDTRRILADERGTNRNKLCPPNSARCPSLLYRIDQVLSAFHLTAICKAFLYYYLAIEIHF